MIRITSKKDGFRRAGMAHSGTREYSDKFFDAEQMAELEAEPMLVVEILKGKGKAQEAAPENPAAAPDGDGAAPTENSAGKA